MKIALIIIIAVVIAVFLLLRAPTYLIIEGNKNSENAGFRLEIRYLFFKISLKPGKKKEKKKPEKPESPEEKDVTILKKIENGINLFKEIEEDVVTLLKYISRYAVSVKNIEVFVDFGFSDPMYTGIATGMINGAVYNFIAILTRLIFVNNVDVRINPDFNSQCLKMHSECIFELKNVHIIITVLKVLKMYLKIKKITEGK